MFRENLLFFVQTYWPYSRFKNCQLLLKIALDISERILTSFYWTTSSKIPA